LVRLVPPYRDRRPTLKTRKVRSYSRQSTALERRVYAALIGRLADARVSAGITQEALDVVLGAADGQVAKWESFARLPSAFMFAIWTTALDMTIDAEVKPKRRRA
jgi:hypothetical protein